MAHLASVAGPDDALEHGVADVTVGGRVDGVTAVTHQLRHHLQLVLHCYSVSSKA